MDGRIFTAKPGSALQSICACQRSCPPLTFLNPVSDHNTDHSCNLKNRFTPSVYLTSLLLTFSLLFSSLPLVGLVIYIRLYDGLSCSCHLSDLITNAPSSHTHSSKFLLCYSTYLVTGPNPRGFLTGPEFVTPAVNSY